MDTMQQKLTQLGFMQTYAVQGKTRIDALFPEKKRCGIYVLHFPDQTYYVGQAKDVCRRYVQHHSKAFPDIGRISFKSVPQTKLDPEEIQTIRALETSGVRLRNITHTSIPATSSEFDVLMAVADQERWLHDLSFADAGDVRATIPAEQYDKRNHRYHQFERLRLARDTKAEAVHLLRYYIHQFIPAYQLTEYDYWSLSCMPKTSRRQRLAALSMSTMEMLVLFSEGDLFVNVAVSEIRKAYPIIADFHRAYQNAYITESHYEDAGFDQAHINIGSFAEAWRVFADPAVQRGIRLLNLHRMRKRGSLFKPSHCPALVDAIYAVPLPDIRHKAKPAHPSEYQITDVADWQLSYGRDLVESKDYESAQVVLTRAFTTFQKNLPHTKQQAYIAAFYLGEAYQGSDDYARAIEYYTQSIKYNPNDAAPYNNRGFAYESQGDYNRAIADYNRAIQLDPSFALAYRNRGNVYESQGDYDRAIADYTRAIQLDLNDTTAYTLRGLIYGMQGEYTRAISDCTQVIQLAPNDAAITAIAYVVRGDAYAKQGEYDRAIADYTCAIQIDPEYALAYSLRGDAYAKQGEYDHAMHDHNRAIQLDPSDTAAYRNRGRAYADQGDHDRAIADYTRAIELDPDESKAYHSRGFTYAARGNTPEAIADLERFISMSDSAELVAEAEAKLSELRP